MLRRNANDDLVVVFSTPASLELQTPAPAACSGSLEQARCAWQPFPRQRLLWQQTGLE